MNPWYRSPQTWQAHGLIWEFTYSELTAKRTITAEGLTLDVPIVDTTKFPSPQAWLGAWAKKNTSRLQQPQEIEPELDFQQPGLWEGSSTQKDESSTSALQISVEVVETSELTPEEERDRQLLERQVERAFYLAGKALAQLRSRRLYRSSHKTFEEYCQDRFGYGRHAANRLIAGAAVVENLVPNGHQNQPEEMVTRGAQILPTSERQVRSLTSLDPSQQRSVWQQAVTEAGGQVPSGRIVKDIVQRIRERTKVPNPYRVGEVCQLIAQDNPDLRGKGGCWCIVEKVHSFGCTVTTWDGSYTVRLEHLKSLDYTDSECQGMKELCARLARLHSKDLEEAARSVLQSLGHLKRPYLTALSEKLLEVLETEYGKH